MERTPSGESVLFLRDDRHGNCTPVPDSGSVPDPLGKGGRMGVFDNNEGNTSSGGFSDVTGGSSASADSNAAPADFSDVSGGSSSTAPAAGQTYTVKSG